jgi:phosphatidylserine/phosphatidylglycerophosphate/cardiolipin synthase-like enzyme
VLQKPFLICSFAFLVACCTTSVQSDKSATDSPSSVETTASDGRPGEAVAAPGESSIEAIVNDEYQQLVMDMIDGAQSSIRVVHFECNDDWTIDKIVGRLVSAQKRGVDVQVLLEAEVDDNANRVEQFKGAGVNAKLDTDKKYTHAKLFVVDKREVLLGSTNLSYKSILHNNETNLHIIDDEVGSYYFEYANALWNAPDKVPQLEPVSVPEIGLVRTLHDGDYFGQAHPLIQEAKERILLLIYAIHLNPDYPDSDIHKLATALVEARKRGVEVRVILEVSDYNHTLNDMNQVAADTLATGCVDVRFEPIEQISHAKLLIVDDTAVVGSNNWGYGGLYLYHEVGSVTVNADVLAKLTTYFEGIWGESSKASGNCRR